MTPAHRAFSALSMALPAALLIGFAGGCESAQTATPELSEKPLQGRRVIDRVGVRAVSESIGPIGRPGRPGARLLTTQRLAGASAGPVGAEPGRAVDAAPGEMVEVRYAVRDAPAAEVLRVLVGELLDRPYIVAPGVQGTITFDLDATMTTAELERFLGALATAFGWSITDQNGVLVIAGSENIATSPSAPVVRGDVAFPGDAPAVRVFSFDHLSPNDARALVTDLAGKSTAKAVPVGRYLVLAERTEQLERFGNLFAALDTPVFEGVEIWTYELSHADPPGVIETLRAIGTSSGLAQDDVAFIPLGDSPRLMVVSRDPTLQPLVRRWVTQLDQPPGEQAVQRYLYRIQHYDPQELQTVLTALLSGRAVIGGATAPEGRMRLVFAPTANQIIVDATPADYTELVTVLAAIDRPPQQVQLQAVIAEVQLTNALEYGVEYFLTQQTGEGTIELIGDALNLPSSTGSAFFVGSDGFALIEALDRESDVTVLSTPTITVRDGVEATIQVGGETPVLQSVIDSGGQTGGTTDLRNEIVFRDTGVKLTVQPEINESGYVTLRLQQEVNDAVANTTSGIDSPEFTTRLIETEVVAPHGITFMLGGIIDATETVRVDRIPLLGDLPLLGPLFSMNRDSIERTELIVTITPTIIDDPLLAGELASDFIRSARSVELAITGWPHAIPQSMLDATLPLEPDEIEEGERGEPDVEYDAPESGRVDDEPEAPSSAAAGALRFLAALFQTAGG